MNEPSQLNLLPADQASVLLRKRGFWKRTMSISLTAGVIFALLAVSGTVITMIRAFSSLQENGSADPAALASDISTAMLIGMWMVPPTCLAFLLAMISFILLLSLPRERKR